MYLLVITAGGLGTRFGKSYPKQLEKVKGQEILLKTTAFFEQFPPRKAVVTCPAGFEDTFGKVLENVSFPIKVIAGGKERFNSVKRAISCFSEETVKTIPVLIHDGVRPFLRKDTVAELLNKVQMHGAAIPYIPIPGTVRRVRDNLLTETVNREGLVTVTTPQGARLNILRDCFDKAEKHYTDESTMLEDFGVKPAPVMDWQFNIKITTQEDIEIAEKLWDLI